MKNSEVISAVVGGTFFAVPYLALSVPLFPSLAIGTAALIAGELVFKNDNKIILKNSNINLDEILLNAKKQNKHILGMIPKIEDITIRDNLKDISSSISKIIKAIEKNPEKIKKLKNFFDYYLPVTVKIVDRYDEIENQKLSSKEIKKLNESTSKTINEISGVFKKFLSNLYEDDILDMNVEMKVLNTMLKSDGFDKDSLKFEEDKNE